MEDLRTDTVSLINVDKDSYDEVFSKINDNFELLSSRMTSLFSKENKEEFQVSSDYQYKFVLLSGSYLPGTNSTQVYVDGVRKFNYTEESSTSILTSTPVMKNSVVTITYNVFDTSSELSLDKIIGDYNDFLSKSEEINSKLGTIEDQYLDDYKDSIKEYLSNLEELELNYAPKLNDLESKVNKIPDITNLTNRVSFLDSNKADITYVQNLVNSLVSGSPYSKYEKLDDLVKKYPTGDNHTYLVGSDLYYWDNVSRSWTDYGPIGSSSLSLNSVNSSQRTSLGSYCYLWDTKGKPVNISLSNGTVSLSGDLRLIVNSKIFNVSPSVQSIGSYNESNNVTTSVLSFSTASSQIISRFTRSDVSSVSIDENEVLLGYVDWVSRRSFLNSDYTISGNLPFTTDSMVQRKTCKILLSDDSDYVVVNYGPTTFSVTVPAGSLLSDDRLIDYKTFNLSESHIQNSPVKVYFDIDNGVPYTDSTVSGAKGQVYLLFTVYQNKVFSSTNMNLFSINGSTNGGWGVKKGESYDKVATFIDGGGFSVSVNGSSVIVSQPGPANSFLTTYSKITLPLQTLQFELTDDSDEFWIYSDDSNSNILLYKDVKGKTSIQPTSDPVLLFSVKAGKVYQVNDSLRSSITVNNIKDGGWNSPNPLPMISSIDKTGSIEITFENNLMKVRTTSTNIGNGQYVTINNKVLLLPFMEASFEYNDPESYKILAYNSKNLSLCMYDSNGESSLDFNDPDIFTIVEIYNKQVVVSKGLTRSITTIDGVSDGGWDTSLNTSWPLDQLIIPDNLYLLKDVNYSILPENFNTESINNTRFELNGVTSTEVATEGQTIPLSSSIEGTFLADVSGVTNEDYRIALRKSFNLVVKDGKQAKKSTPSILVIGDETSIGMPYYLSQLIPSLSGGNVKPTMIGTMDNQLLNLGSQKGESRSGWRLTDFTRTTPGGNPLISSDTNKNNSNPFINPTSQVFDFSYYMSSQKFSTVDYVVIMAGYNDIMNKSSFGGDTNAPTQSIYDSTKSSIDTIEGSIHKFNSNAKIGVVPPIFAGILDTEYHSINSKYILDILTNIQGTSKVDVLGNYLSTGIRNGKMGTPDVGLNVVFSSKKVPLPMEVTDGPTSSRINSVWTSSWIINNLI